MKPEDLLKPYVRSASGAMVPLSAVATVKTITGAEMVERFNGFVAAKVLGNAAPGSAPATPSRRSRKSPATLPEGYRTEWVGQAFQEKRTGSASASPSCSASSWSS
jgi:HAE1 family hydrophobic/amphiphilic exporter-1/multidrug efflux pump